MGCVAACFPLFRGMGARSKSECGGCYGVLGSWVCAGARVDLQGREAASADGCTVISMDERWCRCAQWDWHGIHISYYSIRLQSLIADFSV